MPGSYYPSILQPPRDTMSKEMKVRPRRAAPRPMLPAPPAVPCWPACLASPHCRRFASRNPLLSHHAAPVHSGQERLRREYYGFGGAPNQKMGSNYFVSAACTAACTKRCVTAPHGGCLARVPRGVAHAAA